MVDLWSDFLNLASVFSNTDAVVTIWATINDQLLNLPLYIYFNLFMRKKTAQINSYSYLFCLIECPKVWNMYWCQIQKVGFGEYLNFLLEMHIK